jgi:ABC-type branched-subunit amino acid transport system ATPase component
VNLWTDPRFSDSALLNNPAALGRSLMSRPRLLMMDEPSLGLSPLMRERIQESMTHVHRHGISR